MARIRSLHPSLFTDERYMALGFPARELLKGIWCEADDQGVFEWKPLSLKARIMPADAVNVAELLDELIAGEFVMRFEHSAHSYGLVRNFRRFQRPKKPNATHLLPPEFRTYVGLSSDGAEQTVVDAPPVGNQFGTGGEKPPQMEDGGCRRERQEGSEGLRKPSGGEAPPARPGSVKPGATTVVPFQSQPQPQDLKKDLYDLGREVIGSGGQVTKLIRHHDGDIQAALYTMGQVAKATNPAEYLGRILTGEASAPFDTAAFYRSHGIRPDGSSVGDDTWRPITERPGDDGHGNIGVA